MPTEEVEMCAGLIAVCLTHPQLRHSALADANLQLHRHRCHETNEEKQRLLKSVLSIVHKQVLFHFPIVPINL